MRRTWRLGIGGVLLAVVSLATVSVTFAATPMMTRFRPDLDIYPQYFSIARSADGLLYLGALDAVLRFDGVRWESFPTPRPGPVRALLRDRRGRLWAGGFDWFGWLERRSDGSEGFVDVAPAFAADVGKDGFLDIWDILERDDGVYFRALRWLFHVDAGGERRGVWNAPNRFGGIVDHAGELIVNWRGEGLKRRIGDRFELVPGGEQYAKNPAFSLLSLDARRLLVHDKTPRLSVLEDGRVRVLIDGGEAAHFNDGALLDADTAAYAGDDGVLRIVDVAAAVVRPVAIGRSFQSGLARDGNGALLVSDDEGAVRLPWPAPWSVYTDTDGIKGAVHDMFLLDDRLHVLTSAGVFTAPWHGRGAAEAFVANPSTSSEAWTMFVDGTTRLLADSYGLHRLDAGGARVGPDDLYPRALERSQADPARVYVGTESGFALLERDGNGWRLGPRYTNLRARVVTLVELAPGDVWLGSDDRGVMRATLAPDGTLQTMERYDAQFGTQETDGGLVAHLDGTLVASVPTGLFRWDGTRFVPEPLGGLAALLRSGETVRFRDGAGGVVWAWSYRTVYRRDANRTWRRIDAVDAGGGAIEALRTLPGGDIVVGSVGRLMHYDADTADGERGESQLRLSAVRVLPRTGGSRALELDRPAALGYADGSVVFQLGLVDLARAAAPQFQVRVAGLDPQWSGWSARAEFSYAQIPPGSYRFEARARSSGGEEFASRAFDFSVEPRWYQRTGLHVLSAFALAGLVAFALTLIHRVRIRRLDARNRELDALVHAHTSELELANSQLRDLAERDGLTGVANRRRFDAFLAATIAAAEQTHRPFAVLLADVDHFKAYNDAHGHLAGDEVLKRVAAALCGSVRDNTLVARFGGEEFSLVVPNCDLAAAIELGRRLCVVVAEHCRGVTISVGVAAGSANDTNVAASLLARADAALYRAKHNGRNRVEAES